MTIALGSRLGRERSALVAGVLLVWLALTLGVEVLLDRGGSSSLAELAATEPMYGIYLAAAFLALVIVLRGWGGDIGLNRPTSWWPYLLPAIAAAVPLAVALGAGIPATIGMIVVNCLAIGVSEELAFRGILDRHLRDRLGVVRGILAVAVIFGVVHALNGLITGDYGQSAVQAALNILAGIWYGAVRVRGGSLLPLIVIHGTWDAIGFSIVMVNSTIASLLMLGGSLLLGLYGIVLLVRLARTTATPEAAPAIVGA